MRMPAKFYRRFAAVSSLCSAHQEFAFLARESASSPGEQRSNAMTTVAAILKHKGYQITTTDPTATIATLVNVLAECRIGAVLVVDRAEQLLGIVSERDIVRCLAANGERTFEMTAGQ